MTSNILYQVSLLAAFIAGMVALFAPCCISYLLPAYFGSVFKEKKKVLLMTLIYSLGIFVVMLPVVLGARVLAQLFYRLHDQTYFIGGLFMLLLALLALFGVKLPMPKFAARKVGQDTDIISIFTLGIISGITSSCCAPVLVGVITLSSLSPTVLQSLGVGFSYVLGMVTPLYLASLFIDSRNLLQKPLFKKQLTVFTFKTKSYPILVSNFIAAIIFAVTGGLTIILSSAGLLAMPSGDSAMVTTIQNAALAVTRITDKIPSLNLIFALIASYLLYRFIKKIFPPQS
jgi:cytochrome c biogenesis protein CcdA